MTTLPNRPVIRTERLSKWYGRARGIENVDLEVREGEVFGFLGPNGAGKTTTIRTLLDFIRPTSGRATIFGLDSQRDSLAIRRRIGYLPGELSLYGSLTGRELLEHFGHLRRTAVGERMRSLAGRFECDLERPIKALSHGTRQKLGLIQAFVSGPDLAILDEPTLGLDPLVQVEFFALVDEQRAAGRTLFISSHNLPEVERICDRVGIIRSGRLIAVEEVAALKARALRHLEIRFAAPPVDGMFDGLDGVRDLTVEGPLVACTVAGPIDGVLRAALRYPVEDLVSTQPGLEEMFLALYGGDEQGETGDDA
jgi:ABC-2 type transport system ATP-binding protein